MAEAPPNQPLANESASAPADSKRKTTMTLRLIAFVVVGGIVGFAYHRIVGCRTGTCPITANPYISTGYGAVLGYLLSGGWH